MLRGLDADFSLWPRSRISACSSNTRAIRTRGSILVLCMATFSRREASVDLSVLERDDHPGGIITA